MIDGLQRQAVVIMGFPEVRHSPDLIHTVARHKLIAANLDPVSGSQGEVVLTLVTVRHAQRRTPHEIRDKNETLAVPRKEKRTRNIAPLLRYHNLINRQIPKGIDSAGRPLGADDARTRSRAQT